MPARSAFAGYWALVTLLCVVGFVGMFSIGMPFLLLGLVLAIGAPLAHATGSLLGAMAPMPQQR